MRRARGAPHPRPAEIAFREDAVDAAHGNEILNIWETMDAQVFYQHDKDWFYRAEERRWITMNDNSGWRRIERVNGRTKRSMLHVA